MTQQPVRLEVWVRQMDGEDADEQPQATPRAPNRMVRGVSSDLIRAAFCDYFGVRGEHADILVVLYERPGEPVPTRDLGKLLNSHRPPSRGAIHERIRFLREIMEPESLDSGSPQDNRWELSSGYFLTELGMSECVQALRVMAEALTKCGPAAMIGGKTAEEIRAGAEP